MCGSAPPLSSGLLCARSEPQIQYKLVSQSVLVNHTRPGEFSIRAHFRLRTRAGPGPFWVVVWVHVEGGEGSPSQIGWQLRDLQVSRDLRFWPFWAQKQKLRGGLWLWFVLKLIELPVYIVGVAR